MRSIIIFILLLLCYEVSNAQVVFGRNNNRPKGFSVNYSSPKEYEIAEITVEGVQFLDNNALISISGLRVGDKIKIPGDGISSAIKKLWKQGIIGNVSIEASKVEGEKIWLKIVLQERPRLTRYEIQGVSKTRAQEIRDKIDLIRGRVLTDVVIKNTELSVQRYMEGKGYLNAKINVVQEKDTVLRNSAILNININQGQKVKIRTIAFDGNDNFSSKTLRKKMKSTGMTLKFSLPTELLKNVWTLSNPKNMISFLRKKKTVTKEESKEYLAEHVNFNFFKSAKLVKEDYETDKESILNHYNSKGFRNAEIVTDTFYFVDNKYMNVEMEINEGNKFYFRDISWEGNYIYTDEQLESILGIEKGDVYDLELVNQKLTFNPNGADISSLYMDDGYLFFSINPVEVNVIADSIDLEMRVFEGAQATIDKVTISGNDKTNDHVILRQLRTRPGDKFSRANIIRSQRELAQLGYFDPEQVNPVPVPDPINETVDIEWQLVERSNDQVELSGGWGGNFGFVGTFGVTFNNFSTRNLFKLENWRGLPVGDGQSLGIRFQANGRTFQSYSVSFTEPWLGGKRPNSFGVSYSNSIQRLFNFRANETTGWLKVMNVGASLGRRVRWPDDFFTVSTGLSYKKYDLLNFTSRSLGFSTGVSNSITFNFAIARNSVDAPMYPTRGSEISLNGALTPPYSLYENRDYSDLTQQEQYRWLEYHKWNFDSKYYLPISEKLVLASRVHFGYLDTYSNRRDVGPFERFQLGGDGLTGQNFLLGTDVIGLRGYQNNSITPPVDENNIRGGTIFTKYVMELRYPISLAQSSTIYALTFLEAGNNTNDFGLFNPYDVYKSAGFGLRIFMPAFGLMGIDWGYGFDRLPGELSNSGPQFHFSIGQQIR